MYASAAVDKGLQDLALVMMGRYLCVKERERARARARARAGVRVYV
jgi:hypothetical protein